MQTPGGLVVHVGTDDGLSVIDENFDEVFVNEDAQFQVFASALAAGGQVRGIVAPGCAG